MLKSSGRGQLIAMGTTGEEVEVQIPEPENPVDGRVDPDVDRLGFPSIVAVRRTAIPDNDPDALREAAATRVMAVFSGAAEETAVAVVDMATGKIEGSPVQARAAGMILDRISPVTQKIESRSMSIHSHIDLPMAPVDVLPKDKKLSGAMKGYLPEPKESFNQILRNADKSPPKWVGTEVAPTTVTPAEIKKPDEMP